MNKNGRFFRSARLSGRRRIVLRTIGLLGVAMGVVVVIGWAFDATSPLVAKSPLFLLPLGVGASFAMLLVAMFFFDAARKERADAARALRESEHRYRDLLAMVPNPIFASRGQRIVFLNTAGLRLLRADDESQILGREPLEIFHPESRPPISERLSRLLEAPQTVLPVEGKILTMDGAAVPVEVTAASSRSDGEMVVEIVCRDLTERREAEAEIRSLNADLERRVALRTTELVAANKELDAFCYAVSHDLRAPLRAIGGFTRILSEDCATASPDARDYFERVISATERMGHLIDDLLNLSRVSREVFHRGPVNLSAVAAEVGAELHRANPERNVEFVVTEGLTAQGDERLLRILLENLLGNAWKFTSRKEAARVEFGAESGGGETRFYVRDNGAGFDMRYAGKLFGAFQRLHGVKEFPGTGIGLATVQRIVNRHGGRAWAEAEVDRGATIFFTLESPAP
jgi:PAS domain S-box-containing protein